MPNPENSFSPEQAESFDSTDDTSQEDERTDDTKDIQDHQNEQAKVEFVDTIIPEEDVNKAETILEKETGLKAGFFEKIRENPRLSKLFKLLTLYFGLSGATGPAIAQQLENRDATSDPIEQTDQKAEEQEQKERVFQQLKELITTLRDNGTMTDVTGERKQGMFTGVVGKYRVEHYDRDKDGIVGSSDRATISYNDESGMRYLVTSMFGEVGGEAFGDFGPDNPLQPGFKMITAGEFMQQANGLIIRKPKDEVIQAKILTPEEMNSILEDVSEQLNEGKNN